MTRVEVKSTDDRIGQSIPLPEYATRLRRNGSACLPGPAINR